MPVLVPSETVRVCGAVPGVTPVVVMTTKTWVGLSMIWPTRTTPVTPETANVVLPSQLADASVTNSRC
jgi:hypothetical protein